MVFLNNICLAKLMGLYAKSLIVSFFFVKTLVLLEFINSTLELKNHGLYAKKKSWFCMPLVSKTLSIMGLSQTSLDLTKFIENISKFYNY